MPSVCSSAGLATDVAVYSDAAFVYEASLALVDMRSNTDKFCRIQLVVGAGVDATSLHQTCWLVSMSGITGSPALCSTRHICKTGGIYPCRWQVRLALAG